MKGQTMPQTHTDKIATVFGGSGFVGRYIVQRLAQAGWRVRVITRHPNRAGFLRPYGSVGQIDISKGDIRDEATLRAAITGADAVINCVGILSETRRAKFATIHATVPAKMARIASRCKCGAVYPYIRPWHIQDQPLYAKQNRWGNRRA